MHRELGKSMVAVQHLHDPCDPAGLNPAVFRKFFYVSSRACLYKTDKHIVMYIYELR
eukprot:COSAG06_NODE_2777_length_6300_cov_38.831963_3_plen_57_part_00